MTFISSNSSDEDLGDIDADIKMMFNSMVAATNTHHLFNNNKWEDDGQQSVNTRVGVRDLLAWLKETPGMFKTITNFTLPEFEELCSLVCPLIAENARSTSEPQIRGGRPSKMTPVQKLLNFIWYMKCDNVTTYDSYHWNWSANSICDDAIFIASCVCEAISDEIRWPNPQEKEKDWEGLLDTFQIVLVSLMGHW